MRKVMFTEAGLDSFLAVLRPLWTKRPAWLIGAGELADGLCAAASKRKTVVLRRGMPPPDTTAPLLIFTETDGAALQSDLLTCLDLPAATILAPVTDRHFSRQPLFLISIPKAGTHLIYELARALGYHPGVDLPEFPRPQTWYCVEYSNSHTAASDFFVDSVRRAPFGNRHHPFMKSPALFIYRHPLDILVSEAHYYHLDGRSPFAGWLAGLDFSSRVGRLLNDNFLLGSLRTRVGAFLPWMDFPNVINLSFEELVGATGGGNAVDQLDLIWSILLKLQIPGDPQQVATTLFNRDSATFRAGQIGAFSQELATPLVTEFAKNNADLLATLGYNVTESGQLPDHRDRFRRRPVSYAAADFDKMPIILESGFMECNLVRYEQRVYAVPLSLGDVQLTALDYTQIEALPSGPDLASVKALLVLGLEEFARHRFALRRLGAAIRDKESLPNYYAYWTDGDKPSVIETYRDFNIVFFRRRFYAIRQKLGPIELTGDITSLLAQHSMSDVIVAASVTQLYDEIDGLSTVQRLRRDVVCQGPAIDSLSAAHRESVVAISQVNEQLMRLETEIADIHSRVDRHAAAATAAARDYAESLRQQIATLVESMEHSIRAITDATERAEANAATAVADVAALASQQDEQRATMERLRGHINAQIAGSADSTQRRLDLQLEELIRQRGILTELGQGTRKPLCRWLLRRGAQRP